MSFKKLLAILLISASTLGAGQHVLAAAPQAKNLMDLLKEQAILNTLNWSTEMLQFESSHRLRDFTDDNKQIVSLLGTLKQIQDHTSSKDEAAIIYAYANPLKNFFRTFSAAGSSDIYFHIEEKYFPVRIGLVEGNRAIIISYSSDTMLNTLKLDAKERSAKIISSHILPTTEKLLNLAQEAKINYVGSTVVYICKDFTKESVLDEKIEMVSVIFPTKVLKEFDDGKITDQELLNKSQVFVSDKDSGSSVRKTTVNL